MDKYENEKTENIDNTSNSKIEERKKRKRNQKCNSGFYHLLSGITGGIISAIIIIVLIANNLIPIHQGSGNNNNSTVSADQGTPVISENVTYENHTPSNIDELSKSIVGIINLQQQSIWTPSEEAGAGSGIIYKKENGKAYIVTNNHVVEGAEGVEVVLSNDNRLKAKVIGTDALSDLAILEIDGDEIEYVAELGSSKDLKVGETVIAIGNPLGMDFSGSVTKGIISGLNRSVQVDTNGDQQPDWVTEVLQTDAAINPGNSGGALVNEKGKVVGINSMKIARQSVEGIGFAIPIDSALPIMEQLEQNGEINRPYIGITTVNVNEVPQQYRNNVILPEDVKNGMVVANVEVDSPADRAGLQQFDVITKISDQEITSILDIRKYLYSETSIGDTIKVEFYRNGKHHSKNLKLTERKS